MQSLLQILLLCILSCGLIFNCCYADSHGEKLSKSEFDTCVQECGNQYEECSKAIRELWKNFQKNKKQIMKVMNSCCLRGQSDHSQPSTLSFATCVRDRCGAELWGCNIKKRHSGFLTEREIEYIKQKELRAKKKIQQ
ncbi:hypothetical protein KSF78_0004091 [Schistosoma japonicum]|uniref:Uncharacterized protein n=1 Tax=Schistosoma japonicum TaxID=6182 RepID=C1L499_SCHJA|nr:hypothetical protein KSF78_0004091 [Schistosoma japonicum]CAX69527.1 hypothetical protein [Schistosoma japonicum]